MPIDTLKAARRLQEGGAFDEEQAERIAEVLSEMDVAGATKEDLNEMEERLTIRLDRAEEERASLEERLTARIDRLSDRVSELETHVDEKVPTKSELKAVESGLGERIERAEKRILVIGVPVVAAVIALLNYLMG